MKGLRFLMAYGGAFLIVAALFYLLLVYGFGLEKMESLWISLCGTFAGMAGEWIGRRWKRRIRR